MHSFSDDRKHSEVEYVNYVDESGSDLPKFSDKLPTSGEIEARIEELAEIHQVNRRKLQWKMDLMIIPSICLLYVLAYLDRINMGNANVYGLAKDLNLHGNQYNVALTVFFVPYCIFEVPSNILLKRLSPHIWLPCCVIGFGAVALSQGFVKNYGGLLATRFLLGLLETGMLPGCTYLILSWYTRDEAQKRYSFFFGSTCLAGAFGGLIAYGVHQWDGAHGLRSWQWLFILEGAITMFCGICFFFIIADFPETARFISDNERAFIKAKLSLDQGDSRHEDSSLKNYLKPFKDPKIILSGFVYFGLIIGAYGYAYFAPAIIKTFKYSDVKTQVYSIFPWIATFGVSMILSFVSDWTRMRFPFMALMIFVGITGFAMLLGFEPDQVNARYAACFLICMGMYAALPLSITWFTLNVAGHYRKAVLSGWMIGFGNIGGIPSTFLFETKDAPKYVRGVATCLAMTGWSFLVGLLYFFILYKANRQKRSGKADAKWDSMTDEQKKLAGDLNPSFIYSY